MTDPMTYALSGAAALLVVVLLILLLRLRSQTAKALAAAAHERAELMARLETLERARAAGELPASGQQDQVAEFVITDAGVQPSVAPGPPTRIEGRLFADIVLRESVVKAASWAYGVRQVLTPQTRNRIRFEMRQETRRSARQRKADVKEALRQYYAREPGDVA